MCIYDRPEKSGWRRARYDSVDEALQIHIGDHLDSTHPMAPECNDASSGHSSPMSTGRTSEIAEMDVFPGAGVPTVVLERCVPEDSADPHCANEIIDVSQIHVKKVLSH